MVEGYRVYRTTTVSINAIQNFNSPDIVYSDKTDPEFKRHMVSSLLGQQAIDTGIFRRLDTGEDSTSVAADIVQMLRRKRVIGKAIMAESGAIALK